MAAEGEEERMSLEAGEEHMHDDSSSSSENGYSSAEEEEAPQIEWLATTREKRSTAGNRMKSMLAAEEPDDELELLFAEDGEDAGFTDVESDASDVQMDSSSDDEDDQGNADEEEGERELEKQARERRQAARKRKAQEAIPIKFRKKVKTNSAATAAITTPDTASTEPAPRPKKKSERASWLPSPADAPTRASKRETTMLSKEQLHQQMVEREAKRLKQIEAMERKAKKMEALKKPPMTQAERLAEAAIVEKRNAKSLNRWEEAEKQREEERRAKLAALNNRQLSGPVVTFWSGMGEWVDGKLKHVGKIVIIEEKPVKKRASTIGTGKSPDGVKDNNDGEKHEMNSGALPETSEVKGENGAKPDSIETADKQNSEKQSGVSATNTSSDVVMENGEDSPHVAKAGEATANPDVQPKSDDSQQSHEAGPALQQSKNLPPSPPQLKASTVDKGTISDAKTPDTAQPGDPMEIVEPENDKPAAANNQIGGELSLSNPSATIASAETIPMSIKSPETKPTIAKLPEGQPAEPQLAEPQLAEVKPKEAEPEVVSQGEIRPIIEATELKSAEDEAEKPDHPPVAPAVIQSMGTEPTDDTSGEVETEATKLGQVEPEKSGSEEFHPMEVELTAAKSGDIKPVAPNSAETKASELRSLDLPHPPNSGLYTTSMFAPKQQSQIMKPPEMRLPPNSYLAPPPGATQSGLSMPMLGYSPAAANTSNVLAPPNGVQRQSPLSMPQTNPRLPPIPSSTPAPPPPSRLPPPASAAPTKAPNPQPSYKQKPQTTNLNTKPTPVQPQLTPSKSGQQPTHSSQKRASQKSTQSTKKPLENLKSTHANVSKKQNSAPDLPPSPRPSPPPNGKATRNCIILQNFDENAIKEKPVQQHILFGKEMGKLGKPAPAPRCIITNRPARYKDPKTGLPFYDCNAYKEIQKLQRGDYRWSQVVGAWVGTASLAAQGVPARFLDPNAPPPAKPKEVRLEPSSKDNPVTRTTTSTTSAPTGTNQVAATGESSTGPQKPAQPAQPTQPVKAVVLNPPTITSPATKPLDAVKVDPTAPVQIAKPQPIAEATVSTQVDAAPTSKPEPNSALTAATTSATTPATALVTAPPTAPALTVESAPPLDILAPPGQ
ncbi:YL1 nuclear protein-domain-containing protein [Xylariales sp. PMI_506]|nr:YL1 nuclear protein-domain-containing protein [Xylariales sp. PMI_506]